MLSMHLAQTPLIAIHTYQNQSKNVVGKVDIFASAHFWRPQMLAVSLSP